MKRCLSIFISMLCWVPASVASEAIPIHVANFNYTDYYGGIQNWGLDISDEEILYCGNNAGLLRYNGNNWTLMEPDTTATVRAVLCADSVIYTAGDNNIGFWKQRAAGNYEYVSLLPQADEIGVRGETFWNIARHGRKVYFHSFANILCYDGRQLRYVVRNDHYKGLFPTPEAIFTQKRDGSILRIGKDEALDPFCDDPVLHGQEAKFLFALDDEVYLCGLSNGALPPVLLAGNRRPSPRTGRMRRHVPEPDPGRRNNRTRRIPRRRRLGGIPANRNVSAARSERTRSPLLRTRQPLALAGQRDLGSLHQSRGL